MSPDSAEPTGPLQATLVIIGGGGAGLAAALAAAESGLSNIVVLEKRGALGGNTALATGLFACESPAQARDKTIADKDELFKKAMDWAHWSRINPRIIRAFLNKSGDTIAWLEKKGLEFTVFTFFPNQNPRVEHIPKGRGAQLTRVLADECRAAGVRLLLNCAGTKVLFDSRHKIVAVAAALGAESIELKTENVIIATGGFGGNRSLLQKLCRDYYPDMPSLGLPLTGDGIAIAAEAGAATEDFATLIKEGPRLKLDNPLLQVEREPETVWVNKIGERFTDESIGMHPFEGVNPMIRQPDHVMYSLLDAKLKTRMAEKKPGLDDALQREVLRERVKISESWQEIARWIGARPGALEANVAEYNGFCEHGHDELFAKDRRFLAPLKTAPFIAIRCVPQFLDTIGGIVINERMEVLDQEMAWINGLYAAGVVTSGWETETYCSDLSGSAFGYAINSGRIAGEQAARRILAAGA